MKHLLLISILLSACNSYQSVLPGHKALIFDPEGGLKRDIVGEGRRKLGRGCTFHACKSLVDFDVTFSTKHEDIHTTSQEGLALDLKLAVIYKPIVSELYELDTEVGQNYYEEVVGPDLRSAASTVFARHSWTELAANKEKIEDEIEQNVQRRIQGKHVAITSITLDSIQYAPEIAAAVRARIVGEQEAVRQRAAMEQEAVRQKAALENEALKKKLAIENESAQQKLTLEAETTRAKLEIENKAAEEELRLSTQLEQKRNERSIAEEDALLEKAKAAGSLAKAKAEAEAMTILARAHADENRAQTQSISALTVQMEAYKALGKLGGTGTTILLGDFSHIPQFLFPPSVMQSLLAPRVAQE